MELNQLDKISKEKEFRTQFDKLTINWGGIIINFLM